MNVCERYELMISALLDGELDERDKAELSAHVAGCEHCGALAAAFAAVSGALREDLEEPPADLHGAIMEKVGAAAKVRRSQTRFMRLRPIVTAAACIAVVVVTLLAANRGLHNARDTADAGNAEAFAAAPEAPVYAGGDGSAAINGAAPDVGGESGGDMPASAPAEAPAGAAMDHDVSNARSMNDAAMAEEAVAENKVGVVGFESEAEAPAALPELEVETVAAGEGFFTATVLADPGGRFAAGAQITILSDEALSPGMRVTVRYSAIDAEYVTAEEIEIIE